MGVNILFFETFKQFNLGIKLTRKSMFTLSVIRNCIEAGLAPLFTLWCLKPPRALADVERALRWEGHQFPKIISSCVSDVSWDSEWLACCLIVRLC